MTATNIGQKVEKRKEWMSNQMWNAKLEATQDSLHINIVLAMHSVIQTAFTLHDFHKAKPGNVTISSTTILFNIVNLTDS